MTLGGATGNIVTHMSHLLLAACDILVQKRDEHRKELANLQEKMELKEVTKFGSYWKMKLILIPQSKPENISE